MRFFADKEARPGHDRNRPTPAWKAWVQAARLPSQLYIFWPLLLGQALAMRDGFSWGIVAACILYGLACQLYIVFANDVADMATDCRNRTYTLFSGGSRVLVDGLLTRRQLALAAALCAAVTVMSGLYLGLAHQTWLPLPLILLGLALLWAYSYPPFRLSYRGGGEYLQMIGVGLVLPLIGYSAHAGSLAGLPWLLLPLLLIVSLSCAMATALPDEPSDRLDGKRTHAVRVGVVASQRQMLRLNALALAWLVLMPLPGLTLALRTALALPACILWLACICLAGSRPGEIRLVFFVAGQVVFALTPIIGLATYTLATLPNLP